MKEYKDNFELHEPFYIEGKWSLPNSSKGISGRIEHTLEGGLKLLLNGTFDEDHRNRKTSFEFIHGVSQSGKKITLYNSFITSQTFGVTTVTEIFSNYLLVGAHFCSKKDFNFLKVKLEFFHFDEWLGEKGIENSFPNDPTIKEGAYAINYVGTGNFSVKATSTVKIESDTNVNISWADMGRSSTMSVKRCLYICPRNRKPFYWFLDHSRQMNSFLKLCIGSDTTFRRFILIKDTIKDEGRKRNKPVYLYFGSLDKRQEKGIDIRRMNTNYFMLKDKLEIYLQNWFKLSTTTHNSLQLVFGHLFKKEQLGHFEFLAVAQALEVFHRDISGNKSMTFQQRLLSLAKGQSSKVRSHLSRRYTFFIKQIVNSRNYYTHYTPKKYALKGIQLYWATEKLEIFFLCILYKEVGLSKKLIDQILEDNFSYKQIKEIKV